jgi:hypothetical protein
MILAPEGTWTAPNIGEAITYGDYKDRLKEVVDWTDENKVRNGEGHLKTIMDNI